jgi:hypothetical protein
VLRPCRVLGAAVDGPKYTLPHQNQSAALVAVFEPRALPSARNVTHSRCFPVPKGSSQRLRSWPT